MNDVAGAAEVRDNGYSTSGERFENHARTIVANGWKHEHISRSEVLEHFRMAEPPAKENTFLDFKRSCKLLEEVTLLAPALPRQSGPPSHNGGRRAGRATL